MIVVITTIVKQSPGEARQPHHRRYSAERSLSLSSLKIKNVMVEFMKGLSVSTTKITLPSMKFTPLNA
ncbi:MAG: hypothetical protein H0U54_05665 [Acidobacteria bacterium]|nr:hypothetical protein [Acidobacteriota bacterium]